MNHRFDPGYFEEPFRTLVQEYPEADVYPFSCAAGPGQNRRHAFCLPSEDPRHPWEWPAMIRVVTVYWRRILVAMNWVFTGLVGAKTILLHTARGQDLVRLNPS